MNRPLTFACIGLVLGEATAVLIAKNGKVTNTLLFLLFIFTISFAGFALIKVVKAGNNSADLRIKKANLKRLLLFFLIFLLVGAFRLQHFDQKLKAADSFKTNADLICLGEVERIESKDDYSKCSIKAKYLLDEQRGKSIKNIKLILNAEAFDNIRVGNIIKADCSNKGFNTARNPGNFDQKKYNNSLGYFANLKVKNISVSDYGVNYFKEAVYNLKDKIQTLIDEIAGDKAPLIKAIITADKADLSPDTKNAYQLAGISHILAVSGLHVSIIGMAFYKLLRKVFSFTPAAIAAVFLMFGFSILCGNSVSIMRAVIMFAIKLLADVLGKRYDIITALSLAAILLLLANPYYLFNISFEMSFIAISAIVILGNALIKAFEIKSDIAKAAITSLSIMFFSAPLLINSFFQISPYSVLINLIVIPLMSMVLASGLLSIVIASFSLLLAKMFVAAAYYVLCFYELICKLLEILPFCTVNIANMSTARITIYYLLVLFVILLCLLRINCLKKSDFRLAKLKYFLNNKRKFALTVFILFALIILSCTVRFNSNLQVIFMDVGQGDGIVIKTPNNRFILIDGGSSDVKDLYENRLESCLKYYGIKSIDYSIISHADSDHTSGVIEMLNSPYVDKVKVKNIILSEAAKNNDNYRELKSAAKNAGCEINYISRSAKISLDGVTLNSLYPIKGDYSDDENENSQVLTLSFAEFDLLLTGDLGKEGEEKLLKAGLDKEKYEVLKVGHHGSKNSSTKEFLEAVNPDTAVISAGVNNRYGHPHKETLERLENMNAKIYTTNKSGAIVLETDGKSYNIKPYLIDNESQYN
ncbi:MAG: DNA internalization-related competence protein ComEC/Rec2 [Parasporobacterium sp.]|nr:DNA internalization-related competence protein ComEC/Rec2 [Parasporobacterium sp.]